MAASLGLDGNGVVFNALDGYLRRAGLYNVVRREFSIPVGEWGGRIGSLMATDGRAAFTRLCELLRARSGFGAEDGRRLIRQALTEWERDRISARCVVAFARKPRPRPPDVAKISSTCTARGANSGVMKAGWAPGM
jgi:hypothetical protein